MTHSEPAREAVRGELPSDRELPPLTDRGLLGQLMDAAWPHYGGNSQPPEFWYDFEEGLRFAAHYLAPPAATSDDQDVRGRSPISTAPKDGTWFVAEQNGETYPCEWVVEDDGEGDRREGWFDHFNQSFEEPTHWWPASAPAATSAATQGGDGVREALRLAEGRLESLLREFPDESATSDHPVATRYVLSKVKAELAALAPSTSAATRGEPVAIPAGWKLVPLTPTRDMQRAYFDEVDRNMTRVENDCTFGRFDNNRLAYRATLNAAPPPPAPAESAQVKEAVEAEREAIINLLGKIHHASEPSTAAMSEGLARDLMQRWGAAGAMVQRFQHAIRRRAALSTAKERGE